MLTAAASLVSPYPDTGVLSLEEAQGRFAMLSSDVILDAYQNNFYFHPSYVEDGNL